MSSLRDQEKVAQGDLAEYEGIGKRYTDHLIRVKVCLSLKGLQPLDVYFRCRTWPTMI